MLWAMQADVCSIPSAGRWEYLASHRILARSPSLAAGLTAYPFCSSRFMGYSTKAVIFTLPFIHVIALPCVESEAKLGDVQFGPADDGVGLM
jgi:hypothetical protein